MKPFTVLFLIIALPLFGAIPDYRSFRGAGGITIVTNPPTGTIVIDGSGVVASGTNSSIGASTNGTAISGMASNINFTPGNNSVLKGTNIGSTAHLNIGVASNLTFTTTAGNTYRFGSFGGDSDTHGVSFGWWDVTVNDELVLWVNGSGDVQSSRTLVAPDATFNTLPGSGSILAVDAGGSTFRTNAGSMSVAPPLSSVQFNSNGVMQGSADLLYTNGVLRISTTTSTNDLISLWNAGARVGTVRSNGYIGIGLAPVYPVSASRQVSTNNYTERFTGDFEFVIVPTETILDNWAAVSASTEVWGSGVFYMNEASGVQGNLTFYNSNQSNRGQAVLAHAATGTGSGGGAAYMVGFRTSIDHNSTGIVDTVRGVWVPQVDNGGGSNIVRHVRGVEVWPLSGAGKSDVLAISATGTNDSNWFAGATVIASVRVAQDVRGGNATTNAVVTIAPVYSQTGTAAGTDLLINRSGNIGSGNQFLIDAQLSSISRFSVRSDGFVTLIGETNSGVLGVAGLSFLRGGVEVGLAGVVGPSDAEFILAGASGRNAIFSAAGGGDLSISVGSGGNLFIRTVSGIKPTDFNSPIYAKSGIFTNSIQINERAVAIGDVLVAGATNGTAMYTNSLTIPTLNATTVNANSLNLSNALGSNEVRLAITNLTDVSVPGRSAGDSLFWNPTMFKWTNGQPAGGGSVSGNSNQIPYLNVAGTGFLFNSHDKSAPGFGFQRSANGNIGAMLIHVDKDEDIGLVQIGPPNPASNISGFVPSLSITNRYAGDGQTTQEMVRVNFVDVDSGSSAESFIQTWRSWVSGTPPASTLVSYAAALRKDGQLMVGHGVFYPSNSLANTFPTAAQLGPGGHWVGNSNGTLVAISSLDGVAATIKVLAP